MQPLVFMASHVALHTYPSNKVAHVIVSEYDQEMAKITNCIQTHGTARKSHNTITRHQENKLSKATSSLFPIKMIAKVEGTYGNVDQATYKQMSR